MELLENLTGISWNPESSHLKEDPLEPLLKSTARRLKSTTLAALTNLVTSTLMLKFNSLKNKRE